MTSSNIIEDFENAEFQTETYNGIAIIREVKTGYINVSRMCSDNGKRWRAYKTTNAFAEIVEIFNEYIQKPSEIDGVKKMTPLKNAKKGVKPEFQGEYLHPKLIHFVAEYVSKSYAFKVAELMDSINDKVHEQLIQQQLPDTPENSKPIFNQIVQSYVSTPLELQNKQAWGYRDSPYTLSSYEQDDLKRDINSYNQAKEALTKSKEALESWSGFIRQYFPNFEF